MSTEINTPTPTPTPTQPAESAPEITENESKPVSPLAAARNWLQQKLSPRETEASVNTWSGAITIIAGAFKWGAERGLNFSIPGGIAALLAGITQRTEINLLSESESPEEIRAASRGLKFTSIATAFPTLAFALSTLSNPISAVLGVSELAMSLARIRQARAVSEQMEAQAEYQEGKAKLTAHEWLNDQKNQMIPENIATWERRYNLLRAAVYGAGAAASLVGGAPVIALLSGISAGYSLWVANRVIPNMREVYAKLRENTQFILDQGDGAGEQPKPTHPEVEKAVSQIRGKGWRDRIKDAVSNLKELGPYYSTRPWWNIKGAQSEIEMIDEAIESHKDEFSSDIYSELTARLLEIKGKATERLLDSTREVRGNIVRDFRAGKITQEEAQKRYAHLIKMLTPEQYVAAMSEIEDKEPKLESLQSLPIEIQEAAGVITQARERINQPPRPTSETPVQRDPANKVDIQPVPKIREMIKSENVISNEQLKSAVKDSKHRFLWDELIALRSSVMHLNDRLQSPAGRQLPANVRKELEESRDKLMEGMIPVVRRLAIQAGSHGALAGARSAEFSELGLLSQAVTKPVMEYALATFPEEITDSGNQRDQENRRNQEGRPQNPNSNRYNRGRRNQRDKSENNSRRNKQPGQRNRGQQSDRRQRSNPPQQRKQAPATVVV